MVPSLDLGGSILLAYGKRMAAITVNLHLIFWPHCNGTHV